MLLRFIDGNTKNSRQRLDNVSQTHLALASGKLVLQNKPKTIAYQRRDVRPVAVTSKVRRSTEKKLID